MKSRELRLLIVAALLVAFACFRSDSQTELRARILDYWRSHSCDTNCRNPIIEVRSSNVKVVRFENGHPIEECVSVQELPAFLEAMPLAAWPKGPRLWLRESDATVVPLGKDAGAAIAAKHRNMISVAQICKELELMRTNKDGVR